MRYAWLLLPLIGCHRAESPEYIQKLLSQTPIPAVRLREILEINPEDLEVIGGAAPLMLDAPAPPLWTLRNRSRRSLWIPRRELTLHVYIAPLKPYVGPGRCGGSPVAGFVPPRPVFKPEEWILLPAGEQVPLNVPAPYGLGLARFTACIGLTANGLRWDAQQFNGGPMDEVFLKGFKYFQQTLGTSWYLPPFDAAQGDLDIRLLDDGDFSFEAALPKGVDRPQALELDVFVANERRELVLQGKLDVISHTPGLRVRSRYRLPTAPAPGLYRALILARDLPRYLSDDPGVAGYGGVSRWIPFRVGAPPKGPAF